MGAADAQIVIYGDKLSVHASWALPIHAWARLPLATAMPSGTGAERRFGSRATRSVITDDMMTRLAIMTSRCMSDPKESRSGIRPGVPNRRTADPRQTENVVGGCVWYGEARGISPTNRRAWILTLKMIALDTG